MKSSNKIQWLVGVAAGAAMIALAAGCQSDKNDASVHGEIFPGADAQRSVFEFSARAAANSARVDATLRDYHFNDRDLNSLGQERLDGMLYYRESSGPLVVYLDLPDDDARTASRKETVRAFLKDRYLTDSQIEFKSGPNPNWNSPVAPLLAQQAAATGNTGGAGSAPVTATPSSGH